MSETFDSYVWGEEDGDDWFADAHLDHETMLARAIAVEVECGTLEESNLAGATVETTVCAHFFARPDPEDEERFVPCMPRAEGANPMTQLYVKEPIA